MFWIDSDWKEDEGCIRLLHFDEAQGRRGFVMFSLVAAGISVALPASAKGKNKSKYDEKRLLEQNRKIQAANNAPEGFPNFIREGKHFIIRSDNHAEVNPKIFPAGLIFCWV